MIYIVVDHGGRAEYPALFIMRSNRNIQFVGNWDRIQDILDNDSIPEDILICNFCILFNIFLFVFIKSYFILNLKFVIVRFLFEECFK